MYNLLLHDPNSRQAVLSIWDPVRDLPLRDAKPRDIDIPCNVTAFLHVRDGRLVWTQVMRSNDLFLGLPHNLVQFTTLQEIIAGWLGLEVGEYFHVSDSLHVYDRDYQHFEHIPAIVANRNEDDLRLPKAESDEVLARLIGAATRLAAPDVSPQAIRDTLAECTDLPDGYRNLLRVLCAEAARRHRSADLATGVMRECTNPVLRQLWERWLARLHEQRSPRGAAVGKNSSRRTAQPVNRAR